MSDAVHYAMTRAIARGETLHTRIDGLWELLYGLGPSIPTAWNTRSRGTLERGERSIDRVVFELSNDVAYSVESARFHVLSSVLLVALTIKQMMPGCKMPDGSRCSTNFSPLTYTVCPALWPP